MRTHVWIAVALAAAGCSDDSKAKVEFTSQGSGPEGTHLDALQVGTVFAGDVVDGLVPRGDRTAFRVHAIPSETYVAQVIGADGSSYGAGGTLATSEDLVLQVPATVREGMAWRVTPDGGEPSTFTVASRQPDTETLYGKATVWTIREVRGPALGATVIERTYVEGFGRADATLAILDPQDVGAVARKPVELVPMELPDNLDFTQHQPWIEGLSMVSPDDAEPGILLVASAKLNNGGIEQHYPALADSGCVTFDGAGLTALPPTPGRPNRRTTGLVCPVSTYCVTDPIFTGGEAMVACRDTILPAAGARVAADGTVTWTPRHWDNTLTWSAATAFGPQAPDVTAGRGVFVLGAFEGADGRGDVLHLGLTTQPDVTTDHVGVGFPPLFGEPETLDPAAYRDLEQSWPLPAALRDVVTLGKDAQGREVVLIRDEGGMITWSRLEGSRFSHPRIGGRLAGRLSVHARRGHTDVLVVTPDGSIDRLALEGDELVTYHLADVDIASDEWAVAAFVVGGHAIVATLAIGDVDNFGTNVRLHLYKSARALDGTGLRAAIPKALTIRPRAIGDGSTAVCWRGPAADAAPGTIDLDSWTVGGAAPTLRTTSAEGDPCVIVGRLPGTEVDGLDPAIIGGTIPGVGRVRLRGTSGGSAAGFNVTTQSKGLAALADGTLISTRRRYSRGGMDLGLPDVVGPDARILTASVLTDAGGAGLWVMDRGTLSLMGATTTQPPGAPTGFHFDRALAPTGVAVTPNNVQMTWVTATGSETPPQEPPRSALFRRTTDGAICGLNNVLAYCQPPSGPEEIAGLDASQFVPMGHDRYVSWSPGRSEVYVFDLVTMTASLVATLPTVHGVVYGGIDNHGRGLIAIAYGTTATTVLDSIGILTLGAANQLVELAVIPASIGTHGGVFTSPGIDLLVPTDDTLIAFLRWPQGATTVVRLPPLPAP